MGEVYMQIEMERFIVLKRAEEENTKLREANEKLTTDLFQRIEYNGQLAKQNMDATKENEQLRKALEQVMEVEAPIAEGWETPAYKIAQEALGGEAHE